MTSTTPKSGFEQGLKELAIMFGPFLLIFALGSLLATAHSPKDEWGALVPSQQEAQKISDSNSQGFDNGKLKNIYFQKSSTLPPHDFFCIPDKRSYCTTTGCEDVEPATFVLIGKSNLGPYIARCDSQPCDIYSVTPHTSGQFISFDTTEPHGMIFRVSTGDSSFTETVTLGTDSFVSTGYCASTID